MIKPRSTSSLSDPKLRKLATLILGEYRKSGSTNHNENLKHVLRMVHDLRGYAEELRGVGCDPEILEIAILVSDVGKEAIYIEKHKGRYGGSDFRAFMDHSRISMIEGNRIRKTIGIDNRTWRKVLAAIIGHDGPSIPGSWWKQNYDKEIGKPYARLHSPEGLIHCYLDRMDQGGIFQGRGGQLNGGLRKISYDLFQRGSFKGNLAAVIQQVFGPTRIGTNEQLEYLDEVLKPEILGSKKIPLFLKEKRKQFDQAEKYIEYVFFDVDKPNEVTIRFESGEKEAVSSLDLFWRTLSKVTLKDPLAALQRFAQSR